jgi:RNA polymerase sigma-70 factor, ECF subfamily
MATASRQPAEVSLLREDLATLVQSLKLGSPVAAARLYDRCAKRVHGLLYRTLGPDAELDDLVQETFIEVLASLHRLRDPNALDGWVAAITVTVARERLQRRRRRWWLSFLPQDEVPEPEPVTPDDTASETLRACWKALELLEPRRRLALVLRHVEGMSLEEGAETLAVSLATFKRLLAKAEADFRGLRPRFPALKDWLEEGSS